jgi:hypothetical protein
VTRFLRTLIIAALTACALHPLPAQTLGSTYNFYCAGVTKPVRADTANAARRKLTWTVTSTGALCIHYDTVVAAPTPIPNPTPVPPSGWTLVTELGPTLPPSGGFRIAYDASSVTAAIDPSGQPALAMRFPAGYVGGSSPAAVYYEPFSASRARIETRVSYATSYVRHQSGVDKQVFATVGGYNSFYTMMYGAEHYAAVGLQGLAATYAVNCTPTPTEECKSVNLTQNLNQSQSTGRFVYGRSHRFDCEIQSGSAGTVNCWLDGVQIMSYSNIPFRAGGVSAVAWVPTWGGGGGTLPAPQSVYLGALRVYGR